MKVGVFSYLLGNGEQNRHSVELRSFRPPGASRRIPTPEWDIF